MKIKTLLSIALVLLLRLNAAGGEYRFTHINTSNSELSYNGISKIFQDSRGFIWIGTFKGLNRYDGTRFRVYGKQDLGLDSDFIHQICEDANGDLWIGTDAGVTRYDWRKDCFEALRQESDLGTVIRNKVTFLYPASDGRIWMAVNYQGCFSYDIRSGKLRNHLLAPPVNSSSYYDMEGLSISFRRLVEDGEGGLWVSKYHNNIFHTDSDFSSISPIDIGEYSDFYAEDEVEWLHMKDGLLYVASIHSGLTVVDPGKKTVRSLFNIPEGAVLVDANCQDGRWIWLSTTRGIWKYDLESGSAEHIGEDRSDPFSITGNYVYSTLVDRDGGLWVGTKDGGISYSGPSQSEFIKEYRDLKGTIISGFAEDDSGRLWITTEQAGLFVYDLASGTLKRQNLGLPATLCSPCFDSGRLWLGSLEGLRMLDTRTGRLKDYGILKRREGVNDTRVYVVYKTRSGVLYAATTLGLFRYDRDTDSFLQIRDFDGVFVTGIAETPDGRLVLSSYAVGLFIYDPHVGRIVARYSHGDGKGLPSDKISSPFVDSRGRIWAIGFNGGISLLNSSGFRVYDRSSVPDFPTDVFFRALEGSDGTLWLASDSGLIQFNPENLQVNRYTVFDGLVDNKLTNCAHLRADGEMFFGSDNGFVHFRPSGLSTPVSAPPVVISSIKLGDRTLGGNADILRKLELKAGENSFGFEFSQPGMLYPSARRLQCCLEGYENKWRDISSAKSVFYYNVPSGSYRLRIRSSVAGGSWEETHEPLEVGVAPKFFASAPGIILIVLLLMALLALAVWLVSRRGEERRRREAEQYRKQKDEEMLRDKMNFFSHVIHEIKTPLTLIRTPLRSVLGKDALDDDARHDLKVMEGNTEYLTHLVNELLDYVRIERQGYVLNRTDLDLVERIQSHIFNFADTARNRNLRLEFNPGSLHPWVSADKSALDKILGNLLLNALKYAETFINLSLEVQGGKAVLRISNDGAPIPEKYREEVFKPFVQYRQGSSGGEGGGVGIGLPLARNLARMHSGDLLLEAPGPSGETVFTVILPIIDAPAVSGEESSPVNGEERQLPCVLVVDDNGELREFLSRKLSDSWSILEAPNADRALALLRDRNVDLLITDISMPGTSGLDLCRQVRSETEISHLPIIILSARTSVESKIEAMEAGADFYIEKPFDLEYLRSCVRNILDRRVLMRSAFNSGVSGVDVSVFGLPKRDEQFMEKFDSLVMENLGDSELSNDFLASELGMSQSTLIRKIKKLLDTTPNNYVNTRRMSVAAGLLRDSHGNNITEICYSVGFTNVSYFAKCFKEQFGVTPTEYASGK